MKSQLQNKLKSAVVNRDLEECLNLIDQGASVWVDYKFEKNTLNCIGSYVMVSTGIKRKNSIKVEDYLTKDQSLVLFQRCHRFKIKELLNKAYDAETIDNILSKIYKEPNSENKDYDEGIAKLILSSILLRFGCPSW